MTKEEMASKVDRLDAWKIEADAACEQIAKLRQQVLREYATTHGGVLPDGRQIQKARGDSYRVVGARGV